MRNVVKLPTSERVAKPATGRVPVMAFVSDADTEQVLRDYLTAQSLDPSVVVRGGIAKAVKHLGSERSPNLLVVDLSGVEMPVSQVHMLADVCEPGVTVIAIGDRNEIGLYRDLLHAGIAEYLVKPLTPQLLSWSLNPTDTPEPTAQISQKLGKMVAFVGARGGVGCTTLAANLAWHLAQEQNRRVALVDFDLQNGDCALALNTKPGSGLRDALEHPLRVDATLLERAMTPCGDRLFVLSSEEPLGDEISFSGEAVEAIVSVLRPQFHYVVVDVPRVPAPAYRRALELADFRVIVADQTLRSVRDAVRLRRLLAHGNSSHHNALILNRGGEGGRDAVSLAEIRESVELPPKGVIPFQPKLFARAAMRGKPPVSEGGRFGESIAALAGELLGRAPKRRRFWGFDR